MQWITVKDALKQAMAGDLSAYGGPAAKPEEEGRLRAIQISTIARFTPAMMLANMFNSLILVAAFWNTSKRSLAMAWALCVISTAAFLLLKQWARRQFRPGGTASHRAIKRAVLYAFALGCLWSFPAWQLFNGAHQSAQIVIIAITIGMLCGGAFALAAVPLAGLSFVTPLIFSSAIVLSKEGLPYLLIIGLLIAYTIVLLRAMFIYSAQFATRCIAELENELAARSDALTKLPNRVGFAEQIEVLIERSNRYGEGFALLALDLDHFKEINDLFGHGAGDEFLIEVTNRLRICTRTGDTVARIAGDEFAILLANIDSPHIAAYVAERIQSAFAMPFEIAGKSIHATGTIGIALAPEDGTEARTLIRKADDALYHGKDSGRACYQFYDTRNEAVIQNKTRRKADLALAINNNELFLEFQPFVDIQNGLTTGYEALLRWTHPTEGPISPADFIPLAEESGFIHEIGEWVIEKAIEEASRWPDHLRLSINVSASQFRTIEIATIIEKAIAANQIKPDRVEIEITESMILSDFERTEKALQKLRDIGVMVALDDFGAGYSSLIHLARLPIDRIKIDRYFVSNICTRPECEKLARMIVRLGDELGVHVLAEGVETLVQLQALRAIGCREAQGYFLGRPARDIAMAESKTTPFAVSSAAA